MYRRGCRCSFALQCALRPPQPPSSWSARWLPPCLFPLGVWQFGSVASFFLTRWPSSLCMACRPVSVGLASRPPKVGLSVSPFVLVCCMSTWSNRNATSWIQTFETHLTCGANADARCLGLQTAKPRHVFQPSMMMTSTSTFHISV